MIETFDTVSADYDNRALRFFSESAKCMAGGKRQLQTDEILRPALVKPHIKHFVMSACPASFLTLQKDSRQAGMTNL